MVSVVSLVVEVVGEQAQLVVGAVGRAQHAFEVAAFLIARVRLVRRRMAAVGQHGALAVDDGAERLQVVGGEQLGQIVEQRALAEFGQDRYVGRLAFIAEGLVERFGEFPDHFLVGCHDVPFLMSHFHTHSHSAPMVAALRSMTNAAGDGMRMRRG